MNDDVQCVGPSACVLHHRIRDGLAQPPLLLERSPAPHVHVNNRHKCPHRLRDYSYKDVDLGVCACDKPAR